MKSWKSLIIALVKDFRLSENQIAQKCGINHPTIIRLRNGSTKKPYPETLKKLEMGLGIIIDDSDVENITYKKVENKSVSKQKIESDFSEGNELIEFLKENNINSISEIHELILYKDKYNKILNIVNAPGELDYEKEKNNT